MIHFQILDQGSSVRPGLSALSAAGLLFLVASCSTVDVSTTADKSTDFSKYRTYAFAAAAQPSDPRYFTEKNQARIKSAIQKEMEARSFRLADPPDLQVSFFLLTDEKLYDRIRPDTEAGSLSENLKKHYGLRYDESLGSAPVVNYTEGALIVHAVDTRVNKMVWEGITRGVIYLDRSDGQVETRVREAIGAMFTKFPARGH